MELTIRPNNRILLLAAIGVMLTCFSILIFIYDPVRLFTKQLIFLKPGGLYQSFWEQPPVDVRINVYIFNVTNADAFMEGTEKLTFNQVGPYVYKEILKNTNAVFNDNGTMTYEPRRYLEFVRELSIGDPTTDQIITPNIPLIGITSSLKEASMFTNLAVTAISNMLASKSFLNVTVYEYLWGYDDRLVTLANQAVPNWINFERFGILDRLMALDNASNVVELSLHPEKLAPNPVLTDEENELPYHIKQWNGSPGLSQWGYQEPVGNETVPTNSRCNLVEGSFEGTVFSPNIKENVTVKMYRRAFCRPVPMNYESTVYTDRGYLAYNYRVDQQFLARPEENPDNACYCYKGNCLPKGLGSLAPCYYDIPIAISQPHFLNADPELLTQVHGMEPNKTLHDSVFLMHPNLSIPMQADLRIQINLDVGETRYNSRTRPFNGLVLPLFWLEMSMNDLPFIIHLLIVVVCHILPVAQIVLIYLFGIFGVAMVAGSVLLALRQPRQTTTTLSFCNDYSPLPINPFTMHYFKPDIRISK